MLRQYDAAVEAAIFWEVMATMMTMQFDLIGKAAVLAGVTEAQVRYWVRKGLLTTRTYGHRQRPLLVEVAAVRRLAEAEREVIGA